MNTKILSLLIQSINKQIEALDVFIDKQRNISVELRNRNWPGLELAIDTALASAKTVAEAEQNRIKLWNNFLAEANLPDNTTVFRAAINLPFDSRNMFTAAYKNLKLSAMRAKIEQDALSGFVKTSTTMMEDTMNSVFPERKGRIYGKSGQAKYPSAAGFVLNKAL